MKQNPSLKKIKKQSLKYVCYEKLCINQMGCSTARLRCSLTMSEKQPTQNSVSASIHNDQLHFLQWVQLT